MAKRVTLSKQWRISAIEWLKSSGYAVGTALLFELQKYVDKGNLNIEWKQMAMVALGAFILFLLGKLVAKPSVKTTYDTNIKAEEIAEEIKG